MLPGGGASGERARRAVEGRGGLCGTLVSQRSCSNLTVLTSLLIGAYNRRLLIPAMDVGVEFDTLFDHTEGFFVGVWRRTPYDIDSFPFCLNAGFMNDHHCGVDSYV